MTSGTKEKTTEVRPDVALRPGVVLYTGRMAQIGYRLNKFAVSVCKAENREAFFADEDRYMAKMGLNDEERRLVRARDWLGMCRYGGNMYALIKIARALGIEQIAVGAQMRGETVEAFLATRPVNGTGIACREDLYKPAGGKGD